VTSTAGRRELAKGRGKGLSGASREALEAISPSGLFDHIQPENARLILLAAVAAFARHGYHATTTREIAGALHLSPAAVYSHFPTKADLLFEASLRGNEEILRQLKEAVGQVDDATERITAIVRVSVLWHANGHVFTHAINSNFRALDDERLEPIMKLRREVTAMVQKEIKRGVRSGVFRPLDIRGATTALLRMVDVAPWYSERGPMSPERLADIYVDLILHMLCAEPGVRRSP
jgi:AcrR family transcriptional regulator